MGIAFLCEVGLREDYPKTIISLEKILEDSIDIVRYG